MKTNTARNALLGAVLASFVGGVYYYTMHRMAVVREPLPTHSAT
jgi:hypothetical protein